MLQKLVLHVMGAGGGALTSAQTQGCSKQPMLVCLTSADLTCMTGAREDYMAARDGFQRARGFRGRGGGTTQRLDGAARSPCCAAQHCAPRRRRPSAQPLEDARATSSSQCVI
jgi:hypothetical protein